MLESSYILGNAKACVGESPKVFEIVKNIMNKKMCRKKTTDVMVQQI